MQPMKLQTRYIVPFSYDFVEFDRLKENNSWVISDANKTESDVYEYVRDSFITKECVDEAHNIKIGCLYSYTERKIIRKL